MNILVTLDRNYLRPLRVMLGSLFFNNPGAAFHIYLIGDSLTQVDLADLSALCGTRHTLHPLTVPETLFKEAPVVRYYSRAMYYRLLAAQLLPKDLDRILYLDPDILVINPVQPLYETNLGSFLMAAATHSGLFSGISDQVNRMRLDNYEAEAYFNSGVLVMNLAAMRHAVRAEDIYAYAREHADLLILPDQDILNGLYGARILEVDDSLWNYDARKYERYWMTSQGERDMDWVMEHTSILHFCGKNKPWSQGYMGYFAALYKHYQHLLERQ